MIRYGIIGTSWITETFVEGALLYPEDLAFTCIYSRSEEKGRHFGQPYDVTRIFTDLNEMANCPDLDAVYIASPNSLHYEQSLLMLQHGKHVICEKPLTVTPAQAACLFATAKEHNVVLIEAIKFLHIPALAVLREAVSRLGTITGAHLGYAKRSSKYDSYLAGELPNIFNPKFATGALMDLGVYAVYPAVVLFGMPDGIVADATFLASGADASGTATLTYSGFSVDLWYNKVEDESCLCTIEGTEGILEIGGISTLSDMVWKGKDGIVSNLSTLLPSPVYMGYEAKAFADFITDPAVYHTKYEQYSTYALQVCTCMEAIRQRAGIDFSCK